MPYVAASLVAAYAAAGSVERAEAIARDLTEAEGVEYARIEIARAWITAGEYPRAEVIAELPVEGLESTDDLKSGIARSLAEAGEFDRALRLTRTLGSVAKVDLGRG